MKRISKILGPITMGLLIYGCNEKISPELKNGNTATELNKPSEYYFRVINDNPVILNYVLHRTGPGNATKPCSISSKTALTGNLYTGEAGLDHDAKSYDISCYFDVEELALYFNGLNLKMEASKNTCEYIAYSPYSFFDSIPGSTAASWRGINCGERITDADAHGQINLGQPVGVSIVPTGYEIVGGVKTVREIGCNEMVDNSVDDDLQRRIYPLAMDNPQRLCAFDYTSNGGGIGGNGQNCDNGSMGFSVVKVIDSAGEGETKDPEIESLPYFNHFCSGSPVACVQGAIRAEPDWDKYMRFTLITRSETNEPVTMTQELPKLIEAREFNWKNTHDIVNYRRGLAAVNLDYQDYTTEMLWEDASNNKRFDPNLMEKYAANLTPSNELIFNTSPSSTAFAHVDYDEYSLEATKYGYSAFPSAADPYLGLRNRVSPFYTFYCLDRAQEIKARIRIVVRDWDRVFPAATSDLELISDVFRPPLQRRQDLPSPSYEVPGDPDDFNLYNDYDDWDVLAPMSRSGGTYTPGSTIWQPTSGWFNQSNFPNLGPKIKNQ